MNEGLVRWERILYKADMVYIISGGNSRKRTAANVERRKAEDWYDSQQLKNPHVGKEDYTTPCTKNESMKLMREAQANSKDGHFQATMEKEIKRVKESGSNSGLKRN